jgi:phosphotransferase system enzyme I (PtsI)
MKTERRLQGVGIAPGIAVGAAFVSDDSAIPVPRRSLRADELAAEQTRFAQAIDISLKQLKKLKTKSLALPGPAAEEMGFLLDAHLSMLSRSRLVRGVERRIAADRVNAERAVEIEIEHLGESFAAMGDEYLAARIEDVRIVGSRLLRNLTKTPFAAFRSAAAGSIILAEEVSPADTALMDPRQVKGFATVLGGAEGHTAIMARALGIPAVLGVAELLRDVAPGDVVVLDGTSGEIVVNPSSATLASFDKRRVAMLRAGKGLQRLRRLPAVTSDGSQITLQANLELPRELGQALSVGAEGLGLVRSEFLYMNRDDLPGEDEQYEAYAALVRGMQGRPVTLRTLDVGGDKIAAPLAEQLEGEGSNPALGLRAIRLSLRHRNLLDTQLAAILRAAALGPVKLLLPMISSVAEVRDVRAALVMTARRLKRRGVKLPETPPPLGVMIEIPGAALAADALAAVADFFAIGTNDLIQYTLAVDRSDERVAYLHNPLHPAVLRLIQFAVEAAMRAHKPVSLCGEMAGDPRYTALLLGLGIRDLSMSPANIPRVKQRIRAMDLAAATNRAHAIMDQRDDRRIASLLDDFNALA